MTETKPYPKKEAATPAAPAPQQAERLSNEDRKIVYRLQDQIDEHGKYADVLKPIALGYAAGKGVDEYEAKQAIDAKFTKEIGNEPQRLHRRLPPKTRPEYW